MILEILNKEKMDCNTVLFQIKKKKDLFYLNHIAPSLEGFILE